MRTPRTSLLTAVALASAVSCTRPATQVASVYVKTGTIGSAGGALTVTTSDDASLAGTSISVPAGALSQPVYFTIAPSTDAVAQAGDTAAGPVVDFEPAGTTFAVAATMTLPITAGQATDDLAVEAVEADGTARLIAVGSAADGLVTLQVTGFTHFGAVHHHRSDAGAACTANSDCGAGEYCSGTGCDTPGSCSAMPATCPADCAQPELCGCDGRSYCTSCDAAAAGTRVSAAACPGESDGGSPSLDGGVICSCPEVPAGACTTPGSAPCFCPTEVACDAGTPEDAGSSSQDGGAICPCPLIPTGACIAAGPAPCFCPIEVACDAGTCQTYSPLPCGAIESCACADGTTQTAGCSGPPTCADACCAYGGVNP